MSKSKVLKVPDLKSIAEKAEKIWRASPFELTFPLDLNIKFPSFKQYSEHSLEYNKWMREFLKQGEEFRLKIERVVKDCKSYEVELVDKVITSENAFESLLNLVGKKELYQKVSLFYAETPKEFKDFYRQNPFIAEDLSLKDWLKNLCYVRRIIKLAEEGTVIFFTREMDDFSDLNIDTKFFERHQKLIKNLLDHCSIQYPFLNEVEFRTAEPHVRYRPLDYGIISATEFGRELSLKELDQTRSVEVFKSFEPSNLNVLIVENLKTYRNLPKIKNTLTIWGQGHFVSVLKDVKWLNNENVNVFYWGDLDGEGFAILNKLRDFCPAKSILMSEETFDTFSKHAVKYERKKSFSKLYNLTESEEKMYERLTQEVGIGEYIRLEQEFIPEDYARFLIERSE